MDKTGLFTNAIIWFGVAISVSEIEAGIGIGMNASNSLWIPLVLGHLIGGVLLFLVGLIGAKIRQNAMEVTSLAFGKYGSKFFATLNVFQLIAWVAVLNAQGANALTSLNLPITFPVICVILAAIIAIWVYMGIQRFAKITTVVMAVLTVLLAVLSWKLMAINSPEPLNIATGVIKSSQTLDFWNIFEISIAMPISWLPVISDYTRNVEKPKKATFVSAAAYTVASLWMYFIGIEIASIGLNFTIAQAILYANLGVSGIIIVALSTVTTNFPAANSAGESAKVIWNKIDSKIAGVVVCALSAVLAISGIMDHYIDFLYTITSVFAPMASVLIVSFYLTKNNELKEINWYWNMISWFAGFIVYNFTLQMHSVFLGPTLLSVIVSSLLAYAQIITKRHFKQIL